MSFYDHGAQFLQAIAAAGLDPAQFSMSEHPDAEGPVPGCGWVAIRYLPSGVSRVYRTLGNLSWLASFEDDLRAGEFYRAPTA